MIYRPASDARSVSLLSEAVRRGCSDTATDQGW